MNDLSLDTRAQLSASLAALAFTGGVLATHLSGETYPGLPLGAVAAGVLLYVGLLRRNHEIPGIVGVLALAVGYRCFIFLWTPSMIGFDPDAYAIRSYAEIRGVTPTEIGGFYAIASLFPDFGALTAVITGLPIAQSYVIWPLLVGLSLPLLAAAIVERLGYPTYTMGIAALIAAGGASTIRYSVAPVPIMMGGVLVACFALAYLLYLQALFEENRSRLTGALAAMVLFTFAAAATHKVAILFIVVILFAGSLLSLTFRRQILGRALPLLLFGLVAITTHWVFLTDYLSRALLHIILIFTQEPSLNSASQVEIDPRTQVYRPGFVARFRDIIYLVVLLALAGLGWLRLLLTDRSPSHIFLLGAAVAVGLVLPGFAVGAAPGPQRISVYTSVFVAAIIAVAWYNPTYQFSSRLRPVLSALVVLILLAQLFSAPATPDYGDGPRRYLSSGEVAAKDFYTERATAPVHTDVYYGDEMIEPEVAASDTHSYRQVPNPQWNPLLLNRELILGTFGTNDHEYIAYRDGVDVYRLSGGRYILKWEYEKRLDSRYNRVYDGGGVGLYRSTPVQ